MCKKSTKEQAIEYALETIESFGNEDLNKDLTTKQKIVLGRFVNMWEYNNHNTFSVANTYLMELGNISKQGLCNIKSKFEDLGFISVQEKASKGFCTKYSVYIDKIKWYVSEKPVKEVKEEKPVNDVGLVINCKSLEDENKRLKKLVACIMSAENQDDINKYINTYLSIDGFSKENFIKKYKD